MTICWFWCWALPFFSFCIFEWVCCLIPMTSKWSSKPFKNGLTVWIQLELTCCQLLVHTKLHMFSLLSSEESSTSMLKWNWLLYWYLNSYFLVNAKLIFSIGSLLLELCIDVLSKVDLTPLVGQVFFVIVYYL